MSPVELAIAFVAGLISVTSSADGLVDDRRRDHRQRAVALGRTRYHRLSTMIAALPRLRPAVALFRSLADPTRLAIIRRLAEGEARVVDLTHQLELPQSTVSTHIACLRDCALVAGRVEGRQVFYSLARSELLDLLISAEALLAATGEQVALCPRYGEPA